MTTTTIKQFTVLFGPKNYTLNIPVNDNTQYKFIDGYDVLTLAVKERSPKNPDAVVQKEFPWMRENELERG